MDTIIIVRIIVIIMTIITGIHMPMTIITIHIIVGIIVRIIIITIIHTTVVHMDIAVMVYIQNTIAMHRIPIRALEAMARAQHLQRVPMG